MTEIATTEVRLLVSPELLDELAAWSPPVRVKVDRDDREPTGWTMTVQTIGPRDADLQPIIDQALYLSDEDLAEMIKVLSELSNDPYPREGGG